MCFLFASFSPPLVFTLVPASVSHFLSAAIRGSCLLCFSSLALALSLLSMSVWISKLT